MTAVEYLREDMNDGRRTEAQLRSWFVEVTSDNEIYDELTDGLSAFLGRFGKRPITKTRISVNKDIFAVYHDDGEELLNRAISDLVIAVAKRLPQGERDRVRAAI
jgi:hypothetical protein